MKPRQPHPVKNPPAAGLSGQALITDNVRTLREQGRGTIRSDVLGSYTGVSEDDGPPVQDADDL